MGHRFHVICEVNNESSTYYRNNNRTSSRTGELPPGWEKKLAVGNRLDRDIYSHARIIVPLGEDGLVTVRIENKVVRLIQATREIVEILD